MYLLIKKFCKGDNRMPEKFKIAIVVPSNLPIPSVRGGAIETLVDNLISENEKKQQLEIVVYSQYDKYAEEQSKKLKYTEVIYIDGNNWVGRLFSLKRNIVSRITRKDSAFTSYFLAKTCKHINQRQFDFIIVEGNNIVCETIKKHTKPPLILHLHNEFNKESKRAKEIAQSVDYIFAVSDYIGRKAKEVSGVESHRVYTIHNCTDTKRFNKDLYLNERAEIRRKYGLKNEDILLIFAGRIVEEKGILELLEAIIELPENIKLMILGAATFDDYKQTDYSETVFETAKKIEDRVILSGFVSHNEIAKYYAAADISVVPSVWEEPAGLTLLESLSTGIPSIATISGGMIEYFESDCVIPIPKDREKMPIELEYAIFKLANDSDLRIRLGNAGRRYVNKYGIENYYNEYVESIKEINKRCKEDGSKDRNFNIS